MSDTRRGRSGRKGGDLYRKVRKAQRAAEAITIEEGKATAASFGINCYGMSSGQARRAAMRAIIREARREVGQGIAGGGK